MNADMFNKTKKKIYGSLMAAAALLIALIAAASIAVFWGMFGDVCLSMAKGRLDRSISASRLYLDSIMSTTHTLALNREITAALEGGAGNLTEALDAARNYSLYINGITVYGTDGSVYASSGIYGVPDTEQLRGNAGIAGFWDDADSDEYVSVRNDCVVKAYDGVPYDGSAGIVSCCSKVYSDEGELLGCIFADVFPESLFGYFSFSGDKRLEGSAAVIAFDGGYLCSEGAAAGEKYMLAGSGAITDGRLVISSARNFYGATVSIAVPLLPLYSDVAVTAAAITGCGAALLAATHFISARIAGAVAGRLNGLLVKMTASTRRFS